MRLWSAYAHAVVREMVRACRSFCRWRDGSNIAKGFATLRRILNIRAGRKSLKTYFQAWKEVFTLEKQIRYTQRRESRCKQKKKRVCWAGRRAGKKELRPQPAQPTGRLIPYVMSPRISQVLVPTCQSLEFQFMGLMGARHFLDII